MAAAEEATGCRATDSLPSPCHLPAISQVQLQSTKLQGKAGKEKKVAEHDAQACRAMLPALLLLFHGCITC